jgi:molecular chaperone DnaK
MEALTTAQHKLAEAMYAKAAHRGSGGAEADGNSGPTGGGQGERPRDDVVDADFEEVKE